MKSLPHRFALLLFMAGTLNLLHAQKSIKKADDAFDNAEYFKAIELYKDAYKSAKTRDEKAQIYFKLGVCCKSINNFKEAESNLRNAVSSGYPDAQVYLYLAQALKARQNYAEAIEQFNTFKAKGGDSKTALDGIRSCEIAKRILETPTRFKIENAPFNSKAKDYGPCFSDKKNTCIMFSSNREGAMGSGNIDDISGGNPSDLWETKKDKNEKWATPVILPPTICTEVNEGRSWLSLKGDLLFFTRCPEDKQRNNYCGLFLSRKQGSTWGDAERLPFSIDTVNFGDPYLTADGKTLYYCSRMKGGQGGTDIWSCTFNEKANSWGQPTNLGSKINSKGNERYPTLSPDGKRLYFSSDQHPGLGGLDLFYVELGPDGKASRDPENLKSPMNSAGDDFGLLFDGSVNKGYFSSNREGGKGDDDIWMFSLPPIALKLKGQVKSEGNSVGKGKDEPVQGVKVKLIGSDGNIYESITGIKGEFEFKLREKITYSLSTETGKESKSESFQKDGYLANNEVKLLTTIGITENKTFEELFKVKPVVPDLRMPQIRYALGKADLYPESKDSLNYLFNLLKDNPSVRIELSAHTDSRDNDDKNLKLSQARAESCVNYLVNEKGINAERIIAKGYGETMPIYTDAQIKAVKDKAQQEQMHGENRRTTFKVIGFDFVDPNAPKPTAKPVKQDAAEESEN